MKNEIKNLVKEISSWCIDNQSKEFMCDFHLTAHVDWVQIELISGGYGNGGEVFKPEFVSIDNEKWSFKWLTKLFEEMKEFKAWHDEEFKPENVVKRQETKKIARAKRLRKELEQLESELHTPAEVLANLNTGANE